ncbi:MAG: hypothetical protein JJV98_07500 [Desulfosarcina sp.]|nr:hypothetical protein [Desulfobacterales bacterium]
MKANSQTSTNEANRTVLMVDERGSIRTIHKFHQKLRVGIALTVFAIVAAAGAGGLYVKGLQTQRELQHQIDVLRAQVTAAEHQKELLLARAVKAEARMASSEPAQSSVPGPMVAPSVAQPNEKENKLSQVLAAGPALSADKGQTAKPSAPEPAAKPEPVISVSVENFKVVYQGSEKTLSTDFVIRNTGTAQAQGRAVVVLYSKAKDAAPKLTLPPVPLRNDRPRGNRGRRFSIVRFMRLNLQRKVAEPGLRFDTADVFVFDMQGKLLQEKTFEVAVSIPTEKPPAPAAAVSPDEPPAPGPVENPAANSIIAIPSNSGQESQGGQKE